MTPTEQKICAAVLADPETVLRLPVADIARRAGTSPAAVSRFTAKIGYRGLSDFKIALALDVAGGAAADQHDGTAGGDAVHLVLATIGRENRQAIRDTLEIMPAAEFARAIECIGTADRVVVLGVGRMGYLALDAAAKFAQAGKNAVGSADYAEQLALTRNLAHGDVLLCIAYDGSSPPLTYNAELAAATGATIIALCRAGESALSGLAHVHLPVSAHEGEWRTAAASAQVAITTVIDALLAGILVDPDAAEAWRSTGALIRGEQLE
jgi:DNA-binding MurR/RpiR family transcriptional regulator